MGNAPVNSQDPRRGTTVAAGPECCGSTGMADAPGRGGRRARLRGRQELAGPRAEGEAPPRGTASAKAGRW